MISAQVDDDTRRYMSTNEQHWTFREQEEEVMADIFRSMADAELTAKYATDVSVKRKALAKYRGILEGLTGNKWSTLTLIPASLNDKEKRDYDQAMTSRPEKKKEKGKDKEKVTDADADADADDVDAAPSTEAKGKQLSDTIKRLARHEHARTAVQALLEMGSYFRQDVSITKIMVLDENYFGTYGGVSFFVAHECGCVLTDGSVCARRFCLPWSSTSSA